MLPRETKVFVTLLAIRTAKSKISFFQSAEDKGLRLASTNFTLADYKVTFVPD
jgi:hypothetical protein